VAPVVQPAPAAAAAVNRQMPAPAEMLAQKSTDLGYASDVCDYNLPDEVSEEPRPATAGSNAQPSRSPAAAAATATVSPNSPNPLSPAMGSSLFRRRRKLIQKRAEVFEKPTRPKSYPVFLDVSQNDGRNPHVVVHIVPPSPTSKLNHNPNMNSDVVFVDNPAFVDPGRDLKNSRSSRAHVDAESSLQRNQQQQQQQRRHQPLPTVNDGMLAVPSRNSLSQQSSLEDDCTGGGSRRGRNSAPPVQAKIARRKMMRQANAMDNPLGALSDQEGGLEEDDGDDEDRSFEEKQDKEKAEKPQDGPQQQYRHSHPQYQQQQQQHHRHVSPNPPWAVYEEKQRPRSSSQLTPEMARRDWSSRFSNIKNSFDFPSEEEESAVSGKSRSPSMHRQQQVAQPLPHQQQPDVGEGRGRIRTRPSATVTASPRSKSAHNIKASNNAERAHSKEDKEKMNTVTAGYVSDVPTRNHHHRDDFGERIRQPSGRDSVDYHQVLFK